MIVEIGNLEIGTGKKPLVVPEIGINHEGSLEVAKQMVDAAHRAGAKVIKHQTHIVDDEMSHLAKTVIPGNSNHSIYDIMARCALGEEDEFALKEYVEKKGMVFLSTPFSRAAANRLESFGVLGYKIGSGEMNNYPLLKHIASFGKPMIVSTGMNGMAAVKKAVDILEEYRVPYVLLHTTNLYPTPPKLVRLGAMTEMMSVFPDVPVGLSDHTTDNTACISAMALGACLVERHFVDKKERTGPDVVCSMDEQECVELVKAAGDIFEMLGGAKEAAPEERVTIDFAFATVVTTRAIRKGEVFTADNLWVKRPGIGEIAAERLEEVMGKVAACDIDCDVQIRWDMIGNVEHVC